MKKLLITLIFLATSTGLSFAQVPQQEQRIHDAIRHFKTYTVLMLPAEEQTPTVVEVPVSGMSTREYALYEVISDSFQPFQVIQQTQDMPYVITDDIYRIRQDRLHDAQKQTYVQYEVSDTKSNEVTLSFTYAQPISTTSLSFTLDENVQLPAYISIQAITNDKATVILSRQAVYGTTVAFPQTNTDRLNVTFEYTQPLRIAEIGFVQTPQSKQTSYVLRFLARPGEQYYLYQDPHGPVPPITTAEGANLSAVDNALVLFPPEKKPNEFYTNPDTDTDGIDDTMDNCPHIANADQLDINSNSVGDACEDFDVDGVMNTIDNCPEHPNRYQDDEDGDGFGNPCDPEESRITEKYGWIPWLGIVAGFAVVLGILAITVRKHPHIDKKTPAV